MKSRFLNLRFFGSHFFRLLVSSSVLGGVLGGAQSVSAAQLFRAELTGSQVASSPTPDTTATGLMSFSLNDDLTELSYQLESDGVNLKSNIDRRNAPDDVNKIHIHVGPRGENGPHVLNIFGLPSEDDADARVNYGQNVISGIWDDGDVSDLNGNGMADPNDSKPLSAFIDALMAENLYVQVHTNRFDSADGFPGELRGQVLKQVPTASTPEPSMLIGLLAVGGLAARTMRNRQA